MSVRTIYKCDKCGAEQEKDANFWELGVDVRAIGEYRAPGVYIPKHRCMQVCRACLKSLGIYFRPAEPKAPESERQTLEDVIREIVQNEIDASRD